MLLFLAIVVHLALGIYAAGVGLALFTVGWLIWSERR